MKTKKCSIFSVCCFSSNKIRTVNYLVVCIDDTFSYYILHDLVKYLDIHKVILILKKTKQQKHFRASGGSAPSPVPNIKPALSPTTGGSNRSAPGVLDQAGNQDSPAPGVLNQAEIQEQLDELTELYKTLNLRVKRLEDNEKKPEKKK